MTAAEALEELSEISSQISAAVLIGGDGAVEASTLPDGPAAALAEAAGALLDAVRAEGREVTQIDAAVTGGSLFVVAEGERTIAATTGADPTVGLVFYDLKSCLRTVTAGRLEAEKPKRPRKKKADAGA